MGAITIEKVIDTLAEFRQIAKDVENSTIQFDDREKEIKKGLVYLGWVIDSFINAEVDKEILKELDGIYYELTNRISGRMRERDESDGDE